MRTRDRGVCMILAVAVGVALTGVAPATAQSAIAATPDGQPDSHGVWTNFDPTPFEAPNDIELERLAPLAAWFPGSNQPQRAPTSMPGCEKSRPNGSNET